MAKVILHTQEGDEARESSNPLLPRTVQRNLLDMLLTALGRPGEGNFMMLSCKHLYPKDFPMISLYIFP